MISHSEISVYPDFAIFLDALPWPRHLCVLTSMDTTCAATILSTVGQTRKEGALEGEPFPQISSAVFQIFLMVDISGE